MSVDIGKIVELEYHKTNGRLSADLLGFVEGRYLIEDGDVEYRCLVHDGKGRNHRQFAVRVRLSGVDDIDTMLISRMFEQARELPSQYPDLARFI